MSIFLRGIALDGRIELARELPPGYNPQWSNVKLLLHAEGPAGTSTYTDSSTYNRVLSGTSAAVLSDTVFYRGLSSLHIASPINLGVPWSGTEFEWSRMATDAYPLTLEVAILGGRGCIAGANGGPWWTILLDGITISTVPFVTQAVFVDGADVQILTLPTPIDVSSWKAFAFAGRGTAHREFGCWVDGVWQGSVTMTSTPGVGSGGDLNMTRASGTNQFLGYWDEMRISEELFLPWGSDYTITAGEFPNS